MVKSKMKSTKIIIGIIAISMIIGTASAENIINWNSFNTGFSDTPSDHWDMPSDYIDIITDGHSHQHPAGGQQSIRGWEYEDIEITQIPPIPPIEAPEQQRYASIIIDHF